MASKLAVKLHLIREAETSGRGEFSELVGIAKKTRYGL